MRFQRRNGTFAEGEFYSQGDRMNRLLALGGVYVGIGGHLAPLYRSKDRKIHHKGTKITKIEIKYRVSPTAFFLLGFLCGEFCAGCDRNRLFQEDKNFVPSRPGVASSPPALFTRFPDFICVYIFIFVCICVKFFFLRLPLRSRSRTGGETPVASRRPVRISARNG
jgi:hypothetical protein